MLLHVPAVLNETELVHVRNRLQAATWTDGCETVGMQGAQVKRNLQVQDQDPIKQELGELIRAALGRNGLFFSAALPRRILAPKFNCYQDGGTYGFHVDGAVMRVDDETHLRSDLSCTLFLNDPEAYEGGELVISDTYGEHDVKLPAGDLILYPSSSLHQVNPVTAGQRLASFFWVQSMIRDESQRRTLFELDAAIESLKQTSADAEAVLRLTGIYHNLLRGWAEV